jgi:hypothetical protein
MSEQKIVFILGIMKRSGTNFLRNLLCMHPDFGVALPIAEDFLIHHCHHLDQYIQSVSKMWNPSWGGLDKCKERLARFLEQGVLDFLASLTTNEWLSLFHEWNVTLPSKVVLKQTPAVIVTKSPSVKNLDLVNWLFPNAKVIVVVRDGRALVASGMKSFGWKLETAARKFAEEAGCILKAVPRQPNTMLIKYEELLAERDRTMKHIFEFIGVDAQNFDYQLFDDVPVIGSSQAKEADGAVHWKPTKLKNFEPLKRWQQWTPQQLSRYYWIAGHAHEQLGYPSNERPSGLNYHFINQVKDFSRLVRLAVWRASAHFRKMQRQPRDAAFGAKDVG